MISQTKIPIQLQRQRHNRHNKLMSMINSYQLTKQEQTKLEKIKSHTMMEINLRFIRSEINRNYKFPKNTKSLNPTLNSDDQQDLLYLQDQIDDKLLRQQLQEEPVSAGKGKKRPAESFMYDLKIQNHQKDKKQVRQLQINQINSFGTKFLSLQNSRRVHSLGNEKSNDKQKEDLIIRRHRGIKQPIQRFAKSPPINQSKSTKSLKTIKPLSQTRKSSKQYLILEQSGQKSPGPNKQQRNLLVDSRKLKLPEINSGSNNSRSLKKLAPIHEKLKTEKYYEEQDIQFAIGKKLVTESTDSGKKAVRGVQRYLKDLQAEKQIAGRIMKKENNNQKRKHNIGVFKSAKDSIKGQFDKQIF